MSVGKLRTGVVFLCFGVVFLLDAFGVIHFSFLSTLWVFIPVLLIAIGVEKIAAATGHLKPLAYISPLIIIVGMAYAVTYDRGLSFSIDLDDSDGFGSSSDIYTWSEEGFPGAERLDLKIEKAGGRIVVRNGAEQGSLLDGRLRYWGRKPSITSDREGNAQLVTVRDRSSQANKRDTWILKVGDELPVTMDIDGGAARMRLDFSSIKLEDLNLDAGAVDIDLTFGTLSPMVDCVIQCAAAALDITVPTEAGVSIERDAALSHFSSGELDLKEQGSVLETPDFESKPVKIKLKIDSGLSSLRLHGADEDLPESSI